MKQPERVFEVIVEETKSCKDFVVWSELTTERLESIDGVTDVIRSISCDKCHLFRVDPRYNQEEVIDAVIAMGEEKNA